MARDEGLEKQLRARIAEVIAGVKAYETLSRHRTQDDMKRQTQLCHLKSPSAM